MNFNMSFVSSAISTAVSTVSPYLPALRHLDPASTTLTDKEKLFTYAGIASSTIVLTANLFLAASNRKNLKDVVVYIGFSAATIAGLVAEYMQLNSIPFADSTIFANSTANVAS